MKAITKSLRKGASTTFHLWPYFLGYSVGGISAGYKFAGETGVAWTFWMLFSIVLMTLVFFSVVSIFTDVRRHWRNRAFIEAHYAFAHDGQVYFRAVLHVPREWMKLSETEHANRVRAQLKGQGPF